jgi:hypothetical protein
MIQLRILPSGVFAFYITDEFLARGLRSTRRAIKNSSLLIECKGAVGRDGTLSAVPNFYRSSLFESALVVKNDFPFPQVFMTDDLVIVCNRTSILEKVGNNLVSKISGLTGGGKWGFSSSGRFAYLSNGVVTVIRNPNNDVYSIDTNLPKTTSICNYNGQVIVGSAK